MSNDNTYNWLHNKKAVKQRGHAASGTNRALGLIKRLEKEKVGKT